MTSTPDTSPTTEHREATNCLLALGALLSLHIVAVFCLIPPGEILRTEPMIGADQPVHTYNVYMYRQALRKSGLPLGWGCDPTLSAGKWMLPVTDAGGRPQAVLHAICGFLSPGLVVRLFAFLAALTFPIWHMLVAARLGMPPASRVWSLFILLAVGWMYPTFEGFFRWGQAAFGTASYMSPFVLMLFLGFLAKPTLRAYFASLLGLSLLVLVHVLGAVVIAPPLVLHGLFARPLSWRWRCAVLVTPLAVAAVHSFWLVPFLFGMKAPQPPGRPLEWMPPDLVYRSWSELGALLSPLRMTAMLIGLALALVGFALLRRYSGLSASIALATAAFFGLFLKVFGSFLPGIYLMQPSRFILPAFALLAFPAGLAAYSICARFKIPQMPTVAGLASLLIGVAIFLPKPTGGSITHINYAGVTESHGQRLSIDLPGPIPNPKLLDPLLAFVRERTKVEDRLLIQTVLQAEPLIVPLTTGREVISNTYPDAYDFPQFLTGKLFGRPVKEWTSTELKETLSRWGIQWVFTHTKEAGELVEVAVGSPGEEVGRYRAFHVAESSSRFLVGAGHAVAQINRITLSDLEPEHGTVVLRYRYHPAWQASDGTVVLRYPVPEDPVGFIALKNPSSSVTLRFDPWKMLFAEWPSEVDAGLSE